MILLTFTSAGEVTPRRFAGSNLVFLTVAVFGLAAFRKRLLANAYGRKLAGLFFGGTVMMVTERVVAVFLDIPTFVTAASNLWIAAMAVTAGAISVQPKLGWALPPLVIGAVLTPIYPAHAARLLPGAFMVTFAILAVTLWPKSQN